MIQLGRKPDSLRVLLTKDGSWLSSIDLLDSDEDFSGFEPELHFPDGTVWTSVLSEADKVATWSKAGSAVTTLIAAIGLDREVTLWYNGAVWAKGRIEIL